MFNTEINHLEIVLNRVNRNFLRNSHVDSVGVKFFVSQEVSDEYNATCQISPSLRVLHEIEGMLQNNDLLNFKLLLIKILYTFIYKNCPNS